MLYYFNCYSQISEDLRSVIVLYSSLVLGVIVGMRCSTNENCSAIINSACLSSTCQCSPSTFRYDTDTRKCSLYQPNVGDSCQTANDCQSTDVHRSCSNNLCVCLSGYVLYEATCSLCSLGTPCQRNQDCTSVIANSVCANSVLTCSPGWVFDSVSSCRQRILGVDSCDMDSECGITGSVCREGTCICSPSYEMASDRIGCYARALSAYCTSAQQCVHISRASCTNNTCSCDVGHTPNGSSNCRKRYVGDPCSEDVDCSAVMPGGECANTSCTCLPGYLGQHCRSVELGGSCIANIDCLPHNSACNGNSACSCFEGFVQDNKTCSKIPKLIIQVHIHISRSGRFLSNLQGAFKILDLFLTNFGPFEEIVELSVCCRDQRSRYLN